MRRVFRVSFWCVGLAGHEEPLCAVEYAPLGFCIEDVDGGLLGVCGEGVPWCDGYFNSEGVVLWAGHQAEELIIVERRDCVSGALRLRGNRLDSIGVPAAFVSGEGVQCGGDDVLCLPLLDDVGLCAEISR